MINRLIPRGYDRTDGARSQIDFRGGKFAQLGQGTKAAHVYPYLFNTAAVAAAEGYQFPTETIPSGAAAAQTEGIDLSGFGLQLMTFGFWYTNNSLADDVAQGLVMDFAWYLDPAFTILVMTQTFGIATGQALMGQTVKNFQQASPVTPFLSVIVNNTEADARDLRLMLYLSE